MKPRVLTPWDLSRVVALTSTHGAWLEGQRRIPLEDVGDGRYAAKAREEHNLIVTDDPPQMMAPSHEPDDAAVARWTEHLAREKPKLTAAEEKRQRRAQRNLNAMPKYDIAVLENGSPMVLSANVEELFVDVATFGTGFIKSAALDLASVVASAQNIVAIKAEDMPPAGPTPINEIMERMAKGIDHE